MIFIVGSIIVKMVLPMIPEISKAMLARSFSKVKFTFTSIDWNAETTNSTSFGLYIHVPFCRMFCAFCPFYKVRYDEKLKEKYLDALKEEVKLRAVQGKASWLYMGGGTPNLLKPEEISEMLSAVSGNVELEEVGMEGNPFGFKPEYLEKISAWVSKVSMGVETLQASALTAVGRAKATEKMVESVVNAAQGLGLSVNIDLMVGLPNQNLKGFLKDVEIIGDIGPDQVTIYPYLLIPGVRAKPGMDAQAMFRAIEKAWEFLREKGYRRDSVWVFAKGKRIYDSSKDELVDAYFGFGPGAFSTCGNIQIVNPPIELYLESIKSRKRYAFYAELEEKAKSWRRFAHELYKLQLDPNVCTTLPPSIKFVFQIFRVAGYVKGYEVTKKGTYFVHDLTKTVVETLPFPLSNPKSIKNYEEYRETLEKAKQKCYSGNLPPPPDINMQKDAKKLLSNPTELP
ncbi:MAG: radical SAM protein [Thermoplasmata archaeon]